MGLRTIQELDMSSATLVSVSICGTTSERMLFFNMAGLLSAI